MLKQLLEQQDETKKAKDPKKKEGGLPLSWIIGVAAAFLALLLLIAVFRLSNRKEDTTDVLVDSLGETGMPSNFDPNALGAYGPTEMTGQVPGAGEEGPFSFLEQVDTETAADLLSRERPATVAGIFATMSPDYVEAVLSTLPPDLQERIFEKMQEGAQLPAFQVKQVANKLRRDLSVPA